MRAASRPIGGAATSRCDRLTLSPTTRRVTDFLATLGPRWGLPAAPCRVHGYLYLVARPLSETQLRRDLALDNAALADALAWLRDYRLIEAAGTASWRTDTDPWDLMMRALDERRRRELAPALDLLRDCEREASAEDDAEVSAQLKKLVALVEDIGAIDAQARRLSPKTLRRLVGAGGRAARFVERTLGKKGKP